MPVAEVWKNKYFRRTAKTVLWIAGIMLLLMIAVVIALQFPRVQNYIAQQALAPIAEKTHTRIELESVTISLPSSIVLKHVFIEGRERDTLLSFAEIRAEVHLFGLLSRTIAFRSIRIDSLTTYVSRSLPDSAYNFAFLLDAMKSDDTRQQPPAPSQNSGWTVSLDRLVLREITASYNDAVSGLHTRVHIGTLAAAFDKFDIERNQFHIGAVSMNNTEAVVVQSKEAPPDTSRSEPVDIGLGTVSLTNIRLLYENTDIGSRYAADVGAAYISADRIDFPSERIALKQFSLGHARLYVTQPAAPPETSAAAKTPAFAWSVSLGKLNLGVDLLQYDVPGAAPVRGFDPNHLLIRRCAIEGENLSLSGTHAGAYIKHASLVDHSGLQINDLSFDAVIDSLHAQLSDFLLVTPSTMIRQDILFTYPSFSVLRNHPGEVKFTAVVEESHIGIPDLLLFNPSLPIKRSDLPIGIDAVLSGRLNNVRIEKLIATAGDSTVVDIAGTVQGLPDMKIARYDITLQKIATGRNDIRMFAIDTLLPKTLAIPASMTMTGAFTGTMNDFTASADVRTSIGSISAHAALENGGGAANRWSTSVATDRLDLGALMNDTAALGPLTLTASAEGTGLTKDDLRARVSVNMNTAVILGYPYRNLTASGTASAEMFDGTVELRDSNCVFLYTGLVNFGTDHQAYKFSFDLKGADLQKLRLTEDDIRVSAELVSDLTGGTATTIDGHVEVRNAVIIKNGKRFTVDSVMYASVTSDGQTHISLESTIFGAQYEGTISPGRLPDALKQHFGRYFTVHESAPAAAADSQSFTFRMELRDPEILTGVFLPSLTRIDAGIIEGKFVSAENDLALTIGLNSLTYNDMMIDSVLFSVSSDARRLSTGLHVGSLTGAQIKVTNFDLTTAVEHDSIDVSVKSTDGSGNTKLLLSAIVNSLADEYQLRLAPDGPMLQNRSWSVPPDNYVRFGKDHLLVHHVILRDTGQSISLQSTDEAAKQSPLKIDFSSFRLETLSQLIEREAGFLGGTLDGSIELKKSGSDIVFTSDLAIRNFSFGNKPVGDIALRANTETPNVYAVFMDLTGNGNRVGMKGEYRTGGDAGLLDLTLDFGALNLSSIEPFTFGSVTRLSGTMAGVLHVTGRTSNPSLAGSLKFTETGFNPSMVDSYLRLNSGEIGFDARGIELRSLTLVDTLGNTASIGGYLTTGDYQNFRFDLSIRTKKFLLMNKLPDPAALYYGTIFIDSDLRVKGTQTRPVVDAQAKLVKGTAVTFVLPEQGAEAQEQEGIVAFVDRKNPGNAIMTRKTPARTDLDTLKNKFGGVDLTSNIEVTKDTKLRILVDPISGDSLVVQGDATFSVGMYPSGLLSVTGRYEISGGSYLVSFNELLKRDFKIEKGSSLTWFGTPFDANVDITAVYTVKTSALDLVKDQISGMSQEERTKYRQELPIEVFLTMKGRLLKPEITFMLDLPEDQRGALGGSIYAKLNEVNAQDSELNKQVFALLVLGRFVPSDPLALAGEGSGLSGIARSSVSSLLAAQLNRLSQRYVKGVDVNVGLESGQDYSSGVAENRTQLQVALSKSLFDERVTVQIGGNVDLEGPRSQQNSIDNFSGDIRIGYKLTEDGRWQMQVFRQRAYEGVIEGDLTETGVGLVFTIDYDKLVGFTLKPVHDTTDEETK
jgi:translocation and assembly module TamB